MKVDRNQIQTLLSRWQTILRLRDWDIEIEIIRDEWAKSADIKVDQNNRMAILMVNQTPNCINLQELVVHELLHLKLYGMDQMIEQLLSLVYNTDEKDAKRAFAHGQFMDLLETTVEDLTKGFLAASGSTEPLSFDRVRAAVANELANNSNADDGP